MKFLSIILVGGLSLARLLALESAEITAVAKLFDNPSGDEQYKARLELNRLVAQATAPETGDPATVTKLLIAAIQSPDTSREADKYLLRALARVATADAVDPLAKILGGDDAMLREEAREVLSWIYAPNAASLLGRALAVNTDKREKLGLIEALGTQGSATSVAVLAPFVGNADPDLALASMASLSRIGGPSAVAVLAAAHAGDKLAPALKPEAEKALLAASSGEAKTAMVIYQSTTSSPVRLAAFIALMKNAPESAKPSLIESALKSEDADLRHAALARGIASGLPSLKSQLAKSLETMSREDRMIVLTNIHHLKPAEAAVKIAVDSVASPEEDERIAAISALGKIATKPAFVAILQALNAREPRISQAAANALAVSACPDAANILTGMLKSGAGPEKVLAIKAMVSCRLPDSNKLLLAFVKDADTAVSREAVKTLYFTASIEDLRALAAEAAAAPEGDLRKSLVASSSRIATRINTDEARDLVKDLK